MPETLLSLGPLSIHIYGVMIAIGLLTALYFLLHDADCKKLITADELYTIVSLAIISGIIGGKLFYLSAHWNEFTSWKQMFAFWDVGFWVLGTFVGSFITIGWYLYRRKLPVLPIFDRASLYIPIMFAISRLGCFFTGCCYGLRTTHAWAIMYTSETSSAPLNQLIHPTQLYSSLGELFIFFLLFFYLQHSFKKPGQLFSLYVLLMSSERFLVDFFRGDRLLIAHNLSSAQCVALALGISSFFFFCYISYKQKNNFSDLKKSVSV